MLFIYYPGMANEKKTLGFHTEIFDLFFIFSIHFESSSNKKKMKKMQGSMQPRRSLRWVSKGTEPTGTAPPVTLKSSQCYQRFGKFSTDLDSQRFGKISTI